MPRPMWTALLAVLFAPPLPAAELNIGAATALTNAFTELGHLYNSRHPNDSVTFRFALSGVLLQQQQQGATAYDMLALNDDGAMNEADSSGMLRSGTRFPFANNHLVLVVPARSMMPARGLTDLERSGVRRVAVENSATTPAGRYSRLALMQAGIWKTVEAKAVWGQNSHECLDLVASGSADAGFALASEALRRADEVRIVGEVPTPEPIRYAIATTLRAHQLKQAARFTEFVFSPEGQAVLEHYGFTPLTPPGIPLSTAQHDNRWNPREGRGSSAYGTAKKFK